MRLRIVTIIASILMMLAATAQADWDAGGPFKMHYPQLPDPNGWDVSWSSNVVLADDFLCTQSGPIDGVHFWVSWKDDVEDWASITNIHLSIHNDTPDPDGPGPFYSMPSNLLWEADFDPGAYTHRLYDTGQQGWLDTSSPLLPVILPDNHTNIFQINIAGIPDPFIQQVGTIYWLDIRVDTVADPLGEIGWKTSSTNWNDDGVFSHQGGWGELREPPTFENSMDFAYVIVPEPSAAVLISVMAVFGFFIRRWLYLG